MVKLTVVYRHVSEAIASGACELTCIARQSISLAEVCKEHAAYIQVFQDLITRGYNIDLIELPALHNLADSMFVEDVAMLYNDCAILTRPGAVSRQPEVDPIVDVVKAIRPDCYRIQAPGTVDGGDVLYIPNSKYVFVGKSTRSNDDAFQQMSTYLGKHGLECVQCHVNEVLHLKSAVSFLSEETVLLNPKWIDSAFFTTRGFIVVEVDPAEPDSANVLSFSAEKDDTALRTIFSPVAFPGTASRVKAFVDAENCAGRPTQQVMLQVSEIAKAEGALTCSSLLSYSEE